MKVTVAVDDISPAAAADADADVRQTVLEILLELLADSAWTDVHIVIAIALHRRMTAASPAHGRRTGIFDAGGPNGSQPTTPRTPAAGGRWARPDAHAER